MARKSQAEVKAELEAEILSKQAEISKQAKTEAVEMVTAMIPAILEQFGVARAAAGTTAAPVDGNADRRLAENLAHAFAASSATPQKRSLMISPEQKADREAAGKELYALLVDNHAKGIVPIFQVTKQTFLNETMVYPEWMDQQTKTMRPQEIDWPGYPNQAMAPIAVGARENERVQIEMGQRVHALYLRMIGHNVGAVNMNGPTPFVVDGKTILRGNGAPAAAPPTPAIAPGFDPRRLGQTAGVKTIPVLGTVAEPATVTP